MSLFRRLRKPRSYSLSEWEDLQRLNKSGLFADLSKVKADAWVNRARALNEGTVI